MSQTANTPIFVQPNSYLTLHYRIVVESGPGKGSVFIDTFDGRPATLQLGVG
ncbi:MAG: peptidylprolyl isomerase, partial [Orrella sp.]